MPLFQFSPIRSGSTLVYNYLLELDKKTHKSHNYYKKKIAIILLQLDILITQLYLQF